MFRGSLLRSIILFTFFYRGAIAPGTPQLAHLGNIQFREKLLYGLYGLLFSEAQLKNGPYGPLFSGIELIYVPYDPDLSCVPENNELYDPYLSVFQKIINRAVHIISFLQVVYSPDEQGGGSRGRSPIVKRKL